MPADLSTFNDALKEVWTPDRLVSQIYEGDPFLDALEKRTKAQIGRVASTPVILNRTGGYSVTPDAGSSSLNAASNVGLEKAEWTFAHHRMQVRLEESVMAQSTNDKVSVAESLDTEMTSATQEIRKQITRQLFSAGDALIAETTTTTASNTVNLLSTGFGPDALKRRWLHPGQTIDIGTAANETSVAADRTITAVDRVAGTITISGAAVSTAAGDFVSIANARSGATSYEMNGLRNLISTTAVFGGLDPATVTEWAPAHVNSTSGALTLALLLDAETDVLQETGDQPTTSIMSYKQRQAYYELLQQQERFTNGTVSSDGEQAMWSGQKIKPHVDCPDRAWFMLTDKDLFILQTPEKAYWQSKYTGGGPLEWIPGTTFFGGLLNAHFQFCTQRRNSHAGLLALS